MATVVCVHPDVDRHISMRLEQVFPPIGLGYLSAALRQSGHRVSCCDGYTLAAANGRHTPAEFQQHVAEVIRRERPDVVGIASTSHTRAQCFRLAKLAKEADRNVKVVFGGPFASLLYEHVLAHHHETVDFVVRGEGEDTFPELVDCLERGQDRPDIEGISYWAQGQAKKTGMSPRQRSLDDLPFADYSQHAAMSPGGKIPTIGMVSSRGCPYACTFCGSSAFWGPGITAHSPKNVVDEMVHFQQHYGTETFKFHDDTFTVPRARAMAILKEIVHRKLDARLYMHARIETVDRELLEAFKTAGGESVYFGLETGSPRLRKAMGKECVDFSGLLDASKAMKQLGLSMGVFVLLGYPGETPEDVYDTHVLLEELQPDDIFISSTKIQPKTALAEHALALGIHREDDWFTDGTQHFSFLGPEQGDFVRGMILLFDEMYRKKDIRSAFENNNEAADLRHSKVDCEGLKALAKGVLRRVHSQRTTHSVVAGATR